MKRKLIAAILAEICALTAIFYLVNRAEEPAVPTWETVPAATQPPTTLPPTQPPTQPRQQEDPVDPVEVLLHRLSLEQKVGQMFLARCPESGAAEAVAQYGLGGLLLFGRDFAGETPGTMCAKIQGYQAAATLPLLIAVDEEGGTVTRVSSYTAFRSSPFASPRELYSQGGMDAVLSAEAEKAQLLAGLGINVNMAPVCDIATEPGAFMYKRSLGQSPEITGQFVSGAVRTMQEQGVAAVMKHFPGYGNNADTHVGIARDSRSLSELESRDTQPFYDGIAAGGGAILVSHNIVEALDAQDPASLSPAMHRYLRLAMGFDGVIITDDLSMDAIAKQYGVGEAAVLAVLAGNDLLCSTEYRTQYPAVLDACRSGRIPEETVNQAVYHVLAWKQSMGILF